MIKFTFYSIFFISLILFSRKIYNNRLPNNNSECWIGKSPKTIKKFIDLMKNLNKLLVDYQKTDMEIEWKYDEKGHKSPVTKADIECNNIICNFLKNLKSPINLEETLIVSEENKNLSYKDRNNKKYNAIWVIDPLDGTSSYINNDDGFTINIGRLERRFEKNINGNIEEIWKPVFGIVSCPSTNEIYWGSDSIGSFKVNKYGNISRIGKSPKSDFENKNFNNILNNRNIRVATSLSHSDIKTDNFISKHFDKNFKRYPAGSSIKMINVFLNKVDIYPRLGRTMEWDICAATAIGLSCGYQVKIYDENKKLSHFKNMENIKFNKDDLGNPYFIVF